MRFKNIYNFLATFLSTVKKFLGGGEVMADLKDIEDRLQTCRTCEHKRGDELKNMKCQLCEWGIRY